MNKKYLISAALLALLSTVVQAGDKAAWKARTVYQVLTDRFARTNGDTSACGNLGNYCGGTFKGIQNNLNYIAGMGFDAIWISPIVQNYNGGYHGYWATNWEAVNDKFGTEQDLKDLVNACHARNIWVMVDVVANHVGPVGSDFSQVYPLNQAAHYHSTCQINDWNNQNEVENCRLADLPDLNHENSYVSQYLKDWVGNVVSKYGFDGIRIDTIPEVPKSFWSGFGAASGVFQMGECFNGDVNYVGDYQNYVTGLFNYPMYYTIKDVWMYGKSMYNIRTRFDAEAGHFNDIDALGIFVDNHDNARFLNSQGNKNMFKSALVFAMAARGIPFYYYGSEQYYAGGNDPNNREPLWTNLNTGTDLYAYTAAVVNARKVHQIWNQPHVERFVDDNFYAFSRGDFFVALTNSGNSLTRSVTYHPFAEGQVVCNVLFSGDCVTVSGGALYIALNNGEAKIFVPKSSAVFNTSTVQEAESIMQ